LLEDILSPEKRRVYVNNLTSYRLMTKPYVTAAVSKFCRLCLQVLPNLRAARSYEATKGASLVEARRKESRKEGSNTRRPIDRLNGGGRCL